MYMEFYEKVEGLARAIGVTTSTVKKYYLLFEEHGYNFKRNQQGQLLFSQDDINLFKELMLLKNEKGMTVPKAVKEIIKDKVMTDTTDITDITATTEDITVISKHVTTVMSELDELKQLVKNQNEIIEKQQEDFNKQFLKQEAYIKDSLEQRDKTLITTLREVQKSQKEIATSLSKDQAKKKWWQIWLD
ncbi:MerR family transcriptional regulator [Priestia megaterium]